ncbi:hypothetical protein [Amphibacillus sediminis]|uniref:hypothetical protein n=1 Tax=Amphibacillus sediminis TaxID=360185 RepID=UPI000831278B|nr:hypothetical protein [Amphibacillus sediminis]
MKKLCLLFLVISIFISLPSTALFASELEVKVGDSFFLNGEEVHLVDEDVDESYEESEGFSLFAKAGQRRSSTKTYKPLFSARYSISKSEADYQQNSIGVRGRIFDKDGGLLKSKSDSQKHSTIASVKVEDPTNPMKSKLAVGNHTYKRDGFKDTYPETKSNW